MKEDQSDENLAIALAEVHNHLGRLGHEIGITDDPWLKYAYDKWVVLDKQIYLEANGFRDGSGWWIPLK